MDSVVQVGSNEIKPVMGPGLSQEIQQGKRIGPTRHSDQHSLSAEPEHRQMRRETFGQSHVRNLTSKEVLLRELAWCTFHRAMYTVVPPTVSCCRFSTVVAGPRPPTPGRGSLGPQLRALVRRVVWRES